MPTTLKTAAESYLRAKALSRGTRNEYLSTLRKWERWGGGIPVEQLRRKDIREFLDWVYEQAVKDEGDEPGPHGQQGPRAPPRRPLLGLGAGADRHAAAVPRAEGPARRRRPTLPDQGRDQRPLLRHPQDGAAAGLGRPSSDRPVLARRPGRVLQLRRRYRDRLEVHAGPRADPLAARDLGPAIAGPRGRRSGRRGGGCSTAG